MTDEIIQDAAPLDDAEVVDAAGGGMGSHRGTRCPYCQTVFYGIQRLKQLDAHLKVCDKRLSVEKSTNFVQEGRY